MSEIKMTPLFALQIVDEEDPYYADEDSQIEAWQYIFDTGMDRTLPGRYGREVQRMLNRGVVKT